MMQNNNPARQGQIYYADLSPIRGSEQGGIRPVVIVQGEMGNLFSPTTTVVPLTKVHKKMRQPTHVTIIKQDGLVCDSMALCEQLRTIDNSRLISPIGEVTDKQLQKIQRAIQIHLGMENAK